MVDIIAQALGLVGLFIIVLSFQFKKNSSFFLLQGAGGFMFFLNFILIGAYGGAMFNLCNLLRGLVFMKDARKPWKLAVVELAYASCFAFSVYLDHSPKQIILVAIPCVALLIMSVFMWLGDPGHIRVCQIACSSPGWIIHNIFNLSIGGLLCESFNMISSFIYLIRRKKNPQTES
ncbi:MAG: YgjV family protein [Clostridia bacterium]|nr:YgjV family protein [Clostridia bacterium]